MSAEKRLRRAVKRLKVELAETREATRLFLGQAEDRYARLWHRSRAWKELARRYRRALPSSR